MLAETRQNNWRGTYCSKSEVTQGENHRHECAFMSYWQACSSAKLLDLRGGLQSEFLRPGLKLVSPSSLFHFLWGTESSLASLLLISHLVSLSPTPHSPALFAQVCALLGAWWSMEWGLWHFTGNSDRDHPHGKEMQKSKMAVWGDLTNSCEKKRSEKQRRKGKI